MTKALKCVAGAFLPAVLLVGCSASDSPGVAPQPAATTGSSASAATETNTETEASPPTTEETSEAQAADGVLAFGETFTSTTGRKVRVAKLEAYKPSQTAAADNPFPGKQFRKVKITLINSSQEAFDLNQLFLTATSNEE